MKREEVLAVYDELVQTAGGCEPQVGCITCEVRAQVRNHIASALDDAERYRWLRNEAHPDSDDSGLAVMLQDFNGWGKSYFKHFSGDALDTAIDTARAAAAGGEEVL